MAKKKPEPKPVYHIRRRNKVGGEWGKWYNAIVAGEVVEYDTRKEASRMVVTLRNSINVRPEIGVEFALGERELTPESPWQSERWDK